MILQTPKSTRASVQSILAESGIINPPRRNTRDENSADRLQEMLESAGATPDQALRNLVDLANDGSSPQTKLQANKIILELNGVVREENHAAPGFTIQIINPENVNMLGILCPA